MVNVNLECLIEGLNNWVDKKMVERKKVKFPQYFKQTDETFSDFVKRDSRDNLKRLGKNIAIGTGIGIAALGYFAYKNTELTQKVIYNLIK